MVVWPGSVLKMAELVQAHNICDLIFKCFLYVWQSVILTGALCTRLQITVQTLDRRKMPLTFKASVLDMTEHVLVDFRLSKGCGLDFKRHFIRIKQKLPDILLNVPVNWSVAAATNSVP